MDHNLPPIANRVRNIVRAVLFMLKKGISKSKIMLELNMMIKRGKLAGKAMIGKLIFLHHAHHHHHYNNNDDDNLAVSGPYEYEFSCRNSPEYFPFNLTKRRQNYHHHDDTKFSNIICALPPPTPDIEHDIATMNSVEMELEKLNYGAQASPMLPRRTQVRQVRVTDSPFPLQDVKENDNQVDRAAEEFIQKFYRKLKSQTKTPDRGY